MSEHIEQVEEELNGILAKVETDREEVVDPSEETTKERFAEMLDDLGEDLDRLSEDLKEWCADASEATYGFYVDLRDRVKKARASVRKERHDLTGEVGEKAMLEFIDDFHDHIDDWTRDTNRWSGRL